MSEFPMNAYYYGFEPTGVEEIDLILSAVACAGKGYHLTEDWNEELGFEHPPFRGKTYIEWIQNAAIDAAEALRTSQDKGEPTNG